MVFTTEVGSNVELTGLSSKQDSIQPMNRRAVVFLRSFDLDPVDTTQITIAQVTIAETNHPPPWYEWSPAYTSVPLIESVVNGGGILFSYSVMT